MGGGDTNRVLFGEIPKHEVVEIAEQAAARRLQEAWKSGEQKRLNGTVEKVRGYAVYADFEEYIREQRPELAGWDTAKIKHCIRSTLEEAGWEYVRGKYPEIRFYEPAGEAVK